MSIFSLLEVEISPICNSDTQPTLVGDNITSPTTNKSASPVVDHVVGSQTTGRPSNLESVNYQKFLPSPLKEDLSGTNSPSTDPYYDSDWVDSDKKHWIRFKEFKETIVVLLSREELSTVLNFSLEKEGHLSTPAFIKGSKRADFLVNHFNHLEPIHFGVKHRDDKVHHPQLRSKKKTGKRGGSNKKHHYLVHFTGGCHAACDHCQTKYHAGITQQDLTMLAKGESDTVRLSMELSGQCTHIWKKKYGKVTGSLRQKQIDAIVNGADRLVPPSRRARRNLLQIEARNFAVGNHGGMATGREEHYNLNREAKIKIHRDLKFSDDTLSNVINIIYKLKKVDEAARKARGDTSMDYLGIVQDSSFHNGLRLDMWVKETLKVSEDVLRL